MGKALAAFACAAALSAAVQLSISSCSYRGDCNCMPQPKFPVQQSAQTIVEADNYNAAGNKDPLPFDLSDGTIAIVGEQVVIQYQVDGAAREAIYDIVPSD
jgi:hypothetical protein